MVEEKHLIFMHIFKEFEYILLSMNNNFLGIRGHFKTHMDGLKQSNSKSVTYTYIGYSEHNSRGQPIVCHLQFLSHQLTQSQPGLCPHITTGIPRFSVLPKALIL